MTSEILQELEDNVGEMTKIIANQKFKVKDAQRFLDRYYNIIWKMEDLETSRNNWRDKYKRLTDSRENKNE